MNWTPENVISLVGTIFMFVFLFLFVGALFADDVTKIIRAIRGDDSEDE